MKMREVAYFLRLLDGPDTQEANGTNEEIAASMEVVARDADRQQRAVEDISARARQISDAMTPGCTE